MRDIDVIIIILVVFLTRKYVKKILTPIGVIAYILVTLMVVVYILQT